MKKVLLPTDFSANSFNAARYALDMYLEEKVDFIVMHAYKVFDYHEKSQLSATPGKAVLEKTRQDADIKLNKVVEELKINAGKDHSFEIAAHNLLLTDAISKELRKRKIELIIIGSQGHTGAKEVIYGTNTLNIMEEIENCPVLTVPSNMVFAPPKEIVLANSFKAELTPDDLDFLISLAEKFKAAIRILHIAEEGGLNKSQHHHRKLLSEKLEEVKHSFHSLEYLSVPLGIYSFLESRGSGLVAFINKKHTFLENLLLNPLYKNLAHYSKVPVLVLHQPPKAD
ncbi:universal stress protein [Salinimicrobium sp. TH3]|uniref:universal stress protein n=1 Tax=Salinimicrobium sp. TH3 TaxID=2997342 RepID=UPI0022746416|nr:universal stress protein [Salinimicrobium sp. TH3]MCY2686696.1 universal stress protein [Salinimicrobium sp. TH3]